MEQIYAKSKDARSINNELAGILFEKMDERLTRILEENNIVLAAIFLDPRVNFRGNVFANNELDQRAKVEYIFNIFTF